jgi:large subunit ribosomal protein L35Ae
MKALISSYRRSVHTQKTDEALLVVESITNGSLAHKFLGKKVEFMVSPKKKICGKIVAVHGRKGVLRARFSKGLPGQAIGRYCEIKE